MFSFDTSSFLDRKEFSKARCHMTCRLTIAVLLCASGAHAMQKKTIAELTHDDRPLLKMFDLVKMDQLNPSEFPELLPEVWMAFESKTKGKRFGETLYYNESTEEATWTNPCEKMGIVVPTGQHLRVYYGFAAGWSDAKAMNVGGKHSGRTFFYQTKDVQSWMKKIYKNPQKDRIDSDTLQRALDQGLASFKAPPTFVRINAGRRLESQSFSPGVIEELSKIVSHPQKGLQALMPALANLFNRYRYRLKRYEYYPTIDFKIFCEIYNPITDCIGKGF